MLEGLALERLAGIRGLVASLVISWFLERLVGILWRYGREEHVGIARIKSVVLERRGMTKLSFDTASTTPPLIKRKVFRNHRKLVDMHLALGMK